VPKKGLKPLSEVNTASAAAMSGFWRRVPPRDEKLPGVIGVPSISKKTRRGPSELKGSTTFVALKAFGYGPLGLSAPSPVVAGVAATENACLAMEWP